MAVISVTMTPQLENLLNKFEFIGESVLPNTARAINIATQYVHTTWVRFAQGLDQTGKPDDLHFGGSIEYANSIHIVTVSPFHKIVKTDSKIGEDLQRTKDYDMKPALVKGPRSRVNQAGERYNIIPLRHKTEKLSSIKIGDTTAYDMALALTSQTVTGFRIDSEGKKRFTYAKWTQDKKLNVADRFMRGMVRMETTTGKSKGSSVYLTFRVVKLSQAGKWIRKGHAPWNIADEVAKKTRDKVEKFVISAVKKDLNIEGTGG